MTKIWPPKVGLQNLKSIWRGVASAKEGVKFDGYMAITTIQIGLGMTVRWSSNLG